MKKSLLSFILLLTAFVASAQSASEVSMALSMAKSYGYTDEEIDAVMNHDINGKASGPVILKQKETSVVPNQAVEGKMVDGKLEPETVEPLEEQAEKSDIFGHDFFISKGLSLIPSVTAPVPESYVLGPGDQVLIDIWGDANASYDLKISSNGSITIPKLGQVVISGKKLSDAEKYLKSRMSSIYSGLSNGTVSVSIAVGKVRGVSVYVLGAVQTPGVYTLPSLCSAATAIYMAGGIKKMGSVRNIFIFRGGKKVATFDLYKFIFDGEYDHNLRLQDGDIISVSTVENIVSIVGPVRNEFKYEMKKDETISDLIRYAGGFGSKARIDMVHVDRKISLIGKSYDVEESQFSTFKLFNGDDVSVSKRLIQYENRVVISGNVKYPGVYSLSESLSSVKNLIDVAGGIAEGTFMTRASIFRLDENRLPAEASFSVQDIVDGKTDISLFREDSIAIYSMAELNDSSTVSIDGFVNLPGEYEYRSGMTVGDLLLLGKGIKEGADLEKVEVASRGRDYKGQIASLNIVQDQSLLSYQLQAYDIVYVRAKENFRELKKIEVRGEVKYPGLYVIEDGTVRVSDIIKRVNGFTNDAYVKGSKLRRKYTDEEMVKAKLGRIVNAQRIKDESVRDSIINADTLAFGDYFYVGLKLNDAIANPGTDADLNLRDGDIIEVPQLNNTVKISGAVYLPNTVVYSPKLDWRDYIDMAGGFIKGARRGEVFAIYADGSTASRGSSKFVMEPGMEIVVPKKEDSGKRQISAAEIASLTSAVSSIVYMSAILINQLK